MSGCGATPGARTATTPRAGVPVHGEAVASASPTPASRQLLWVLAALNGGSAPSPAELANHFVGSFLHALAPAGGVVAAFAPLLADRPLRLARLIASHRRLELQAEVAGRAGAVLRASVVVSATTPNRIESLGFEPLPSPATSWSGIDAELNRLAGHASLYAGYGDGRRLHALNGSEPGAIGSAFKLYVLGALADAVTRSHVQWNTRLAIRNSWKSLPSGDMRLQPAGRTFTLLRDAQEMISVSDNTAADHLIGRLGRAAVEAQLTALGNHSASRDTPFLTTREMFALKLAAPPTVLDAFAAASTRARQGLLAHVDRLTPTLAAAAGSNMPRFINTIEWFASPSNLAHAITTLEADSHRPGLTPIRQILAINPGVPLNPTTWRYVGYKGGSEPGVISTTWYLRRHDGRAFVLSIVLNDPKHNISTDATVSVGLAAINLLAHA
jgi:beta-lactamase class A